MQWIIDNAQWVFSGIGVFVLGLFIAFLKRENTATTKQKQKSGNNSINIQAGGNVEFNKKSDQ